jgi:hypothetical protein
MFRFARLSASLRLSAGFAAASFVLVGYANNAYAIGQAVGRITGTVTEAQTDAPVPGATIVVTGGSGVNKTTATGEDGTFELLDIPPGTYDLTLSYAGMKPLKRRVVVRQDAATPVLIKWSAEVAEAETTVVQEERHLTNPDSPGAGQIYSVERTNQLPIGRSYLSVSQQIPGVTVGGGNPNVKGAQSNNNRYVFNGLDITDPVTNTFSANFQQDAIETVQVATGGLEAKYNALGAVVSVQTRRGTNEFHGAASAYWQPSEFVDFNSFGSTVYDGGKPWDYSRIRPNQARYELNLTLQGPIVKDHLFFNAGVQYSDSSAVQPPGAPRNVQAPSRSFVNLYLLGGVTYVPTNDHRFHFEASGDPTSIAYSNNNNALGAAGANNSVPQAQRNQQQGGYRLTGEWAWQASRRVETKLMVGYTESKLDVGPQGLKGIAEKDLYQGVKYDWNRAQHTNLDDTTYWWNDDSRSVSTRRRTQVDGSVTFNLEGAGKHEAELGVQSTFFNHKDEGYNTGAFSPDSANGYGIRYNDRNGGPLDTGLCNVDPTLPAGTGSRAGCYERVFTRNYVGTQNGNTVGLYIQDRWKPSKWLTVLPGMRYDYGSVRVTDSDASMAGQGFGPRLSVIADVTGDQKTILQASYGRMTEMPFLLGVAQYDSDRRAFQHVERYDAASGTFKPYQNLGGAGAATFSNNRQAASVDEILLSARREVSEGTTVRLDYTYRNYTNMFTRTETNVLRDPTGTRTLGYVDPANPQPVIQYGFNPNAYNRYSGFDFIAETKLKNFEFQGGYTLSWSWGPGYNANNANTAFENPRFAEFYYSWQNAIDTRHAIKTATTYSIGGFTLGLILNWRSGVAVRKLYNPNEVGYSIVRSPVGTEPGAYYNAGTGNPNQGGTYSDTRSWTEFRTPDLLTANVMVTYDFYELLKQHLKVNLQMDNLLGLTTPTSVATTEGAPNTNQFGLAGSRQGFRSFTMGVRYEF